MDLKNHHLVLNLSEVTPHDLWPLIRGQNLKLLIWHYVCRNISFWGLGVQWWQYFFILTSQRSPFMTSDLRSEVKTQNSLFGMMYVKIYVFGVKEFKYGIDFSFCPLRGHLSWPLTSDQRSKLKIPYLAWYMSKYMFFRSSSSDMALFFILTSQRSPVMTSNLSSEVKTKNSWCGIFYVNI